MLTSIDDGPVLDRTRIAGAREENGPVVLTFLHSFEPGGVERIALRLVERWQAAGAAAPLFLGRRDGAMATQFDGRVMIERAPATWQPIRHYETMWMIVQLARRIRRDRPNLLFAAGNSYAVVAVAMKLVLGRLCPPVVLKISNDLVRPDMGWVGQTLYRLWLRVQGRHIDHFIAMTGPLADQIEREMAVPSGRIEIIANPSLDEAPSVPVTESGQGKKQGRSFCAVGRLTAQKNLPMMLRAFALGRKEGDSLTFYGDGPLRTRLMRQARRLGIADRVNFAGHLPDVRQALAGHDALLLSSHYEGMPSVVIEALEAGLHVIATDCCCSMPRLLEDGALGTVVPAGDEQAFARAVRAAPLGQRDPARARAVADRHRIDRVAPLYRRLFARLHSDPVGVGQGLLPVPAILSPRKMEAIS